MSKCKSCGTEIKWIKTISGRNMPVDAEAISFVQGGEELFVTEGGSVIHGTRVTGDPPLNVRTGYISHFATCPHASQHRKWRGEIWEQ